MSTFVLTAWKNLHIGWGFGKYKGMSVYSNRIWPGYTYVTDFLGIQFNLSFGTSRFRLFWSSCSDSITVISDYIYFGLQWPHYMDLRLFWSSVILSQGFQTILVFTDSVTGIQTIFFFSDFISVISDYFCLQWLYYRDFRLFWSSVTLLQGFQTILVFSDSTDYFGLQWLYYRDFRLFWSSVTPLQGFQTILVFSDSITGISDYFGIQWLFYRDFKLFLSSMTLLQGFHTISVFNDSITEISDYMYLSLQWSITGISDYFGLQWLYYSDFRLFWSSVTLLQWFQTIFVLSDYYSAFRLLMSSLILLQRFQAILVCNDSITCKAFQTIFVFSYSITGISDYFGL